MPAMSPRPFVEVELEPEHEHSWQARSGVPLCCGECGEMWPGEPGWPPTTPATHVEPSGWTPSRVTWNQRVRRMLAELDEVA